MTSVEIPIDLRQKMQETLDEGGYLVGIARRAKVDRTTLWRIINKGRGSPRTLRLLAKIFPFLSELATSASVSKAGELVKPG